MRCSCAGSASLPLQRDLVWLQSIAMVCNAKSLRSLELQSLFRYAIASHKLTTLRLKVKNQSTGLIFFLQPYLSAKKHPMRVFFLYRFLLEIFFKWNDWECFGTIWNELEHHGTYWNVLGGDKSHILYGKVFLFIKTTKRRIMQ